MGIAAAIGVVLPFPFYYWVWNYPETWVEVCGKGRDPSKVMANVSHLLKLIQLLSLFSVSSSFSWPPPLYFWPLIAFGQFLNFRLPPFIYFTYIWGSKKKKQLTLSLRFIIATLSLSFKLKSVF